MPAFPKRAALLAALMALASGAQAQTTLTFGGSDALGSILDRQNLRFTACVNDKAGGKLKVNFIQGEQLGSDVQVIEQTMQGSVQIYGDVLDWYANWVKDYAILAWGFTFRDAEPHAEVPRQPHLCGDGREAAQGAGPAHPRRRADPAAHPVLEEGGRVADRPQRREDACARRSRPT
jgi:hypothetical protein